MDGCARSVGSGEEIVEPEHAERAGPFEERVEHLGGRFGVRERAVARLDRDPEVLRERSELEVGDLVVEQPAREAERVDAGVVERGATAAQERGVEEAGVEAEVVADEHRSRR